MAACETDELPVGISRSEFELMVADIADLELELFRLCRLQHEFAVYYIGVYLALGNPLSMVTI
ncbi:hypothetical protein RSAG8_09024, partial [Rhizoctonia solani AG-8 WAC10335]